MRITYQHLTIRSAEPEDASLLCRWWNDGRVMAHAGFPKGLNTTCEAVASSLAKDTDSTFRRLILEAYGVPVGEMSYRNTGNQTAEIGIKICEQGRQEKGYGTLYLKMLIGRLFSMGYGKIALDTNLNNTRAQHVYEKPGFQKLRVNADSWQNQLGEWQSSVDYELAPSQFVPLET